MEVIPMLKKLCKAVLCAGLGCVMITATVYAQPTYEQQRCDEIGIVFIPFDKDNPIQCEDCE